MKGRQIVRLHSYLRTGIVLRDNIAIVATVSAAKRFLRDFDTLLMDVLTLKYKQAEPFTDVTLKKKTLREEMVIITTRLGSIAAAYALSIKDYVAYNQLAMSYTSIKRSRDNIARAHCQNICSTVIKLLPELKDFGVKKKDTETLQALINNFNKNQATPRGAIISRKTSTEFLDIRLKEVANLLNNLFDNILSCFMQYTDFCEAYGATRIPVPYSKAKRELDRMIKKYYTMPKLPKDRRKKIESGKKDSEQELVVI